MGFGVKHQSCNKPDRDETYVPRIVYKPILESVQEINHAISLLLYCFCFEAPQPLDVW